MLFEKQAAQLLVAYKEGGSDQSHRQEFGVRHLRLRVILVAINNQKVSTKAVNCDNLFLHGCPCGIVKLPTNTYRRTTMHKHQGNNLR